MTPDTSRPIAPGRHLRNRALTLALVAALAVMSSLVLPATATSGTVQTTGSVEPLDGEFAVHFIDVGQADGAYIQLPGGVDIVVDCGRWTSGNRVRDYLISHQVDDVELLIATHPDADHIGGCDEILGHYDVEQIIDNGMTAGTQTYQTYQNARDAEIAGGADYGEAGFQHWEFGGVSFDVLGPVSGDTNNNSVVSSTPTQLVGEYLTALQDSGLILSATRC